MLEVNKALIPLKLYFFYYLGGLACIVPYMPVFAFQLGFSAGEIAVIYGVLPFLGLLSKPVVGILGDKLNAHRLILLIALIVQGVFTFVVYYLPPMPFAERAEVPVSLTCNQNSATLDLNRNASAIFCEANAAAVRCFFREPDYVYKALNMSAVPMPIEFIARKPSDIDDMRVTVNLTYQDQFRTTCDDSVFSSNCSVYLCPAPTAQPDFVRFTFQFWLFLIVMMIGRVGYTAVYTLSDSIAFDLIAQQKKAISYGAQRAFGSLGWAAAAVVVGILMDAFTERKHGQQTDFSPAFYGFVVLLTCATITAWFLKPSENIHSTQILKNVVKLFESMEFVAFSVGTFLVGMLTGLLYTYLFLYMEELHAPKLLMGLSQLGECFGEAPFMFMSSWLISRMGHHGAMAVALASFSVRYIGYSLIGANPWWILILELFHGPGFGLFYANMATFANTVAPTGAVATMQGVLGGIYDGFGMGLGGLIGGTIYQRFGGRAAWRSFGIAAGIAAILYTAVTLHFSRRRRRLLLLQNQMISGSLQNITATGYETPIPPDTPSEKERLTM